MIEHMLSSAEYSNHPIEACRAIRFENRKLSLQIHVANTIMRGRLL